MNKTLESLSKIQSSSLATLEKDEKKLDKMKNEITRRSWHLAVWFTKVKLLVNFSTIFVVVFDRNFGSFVQIHSFATLFVKKFLF